jgi:integrase
MVTFIPYYKKERGVVVIRAIVSGAVAKVISTGIKVTPDQWKDKDRKIVSHPSKKILNQKISSRIAELQLAINKADVLGVHLTKDRVKRICEGGVITTDFYNHCEKWIQEKYRNKGTRDAAMSDLRKVKGYAPSLQFGDIDKRWLMNYERYLRDTLGNEGNTPWKAMKFIRTMIYDAETIGGIVHQNPFRKKEYKMPVYVQPEKDGLYIEELGRLEDILQEDQPVMIKIMTAKFLFMCYTGLRISDAKKFTVDQVKNGERIIVTSQKTGIPTNLKIYNRLGRILEHIKILPTKTISDQKLNDYLKIIAEIAGITRIPITSHVGRHTFGCLLAEMGVSEEEAMKLMGVKNKNVVRVYYQLRQPQIDRATEKLNHF